MTLADSRLKQLDNPSLTADERALMRCRLAAEFAQVGQYQTAREALGELWRGIGERPNVEGLTEQATAEVLLQVGALSGWIGASEQVAGAQGRAKDLISESAARFDSLGETARAALARSDLALCYWREGAHDEARILLAKAQAEVSDANAEQRAKVMLRRVTVEIAAGRYNNAHDILRESPHIIDESDSHALRGSFHNLFAVALQGLGAAEGHGDYYDRAILEYTAAVFHYEQAGHDRYGAGIENNLAFLLYKLRRYEQAHTHLDRAGVTCVRVNEARILAHVDETRARVLIAERRYSEANKSIGRAIQTLEQGGEAALLADAYTVQGVAWARLGAYQSSINILRRAVSVAEESGALSNAGLASLALIEEHGARRIPEAELFRVYLRADELLKGTQDVEDAARLRACARTIVKRLAGLSLHERNFSLHGAVHDLEARFIEQALDEAEGSVTRAARSLGLSYQSLVTLLNTRHKKLQKKRTPARKRKQSIIKEPE